MTVAELIEALQKFDPDTEVMMRRNTLTGTCTEVGWVEDTQYQFFGKVLPCAMIEALVDCDGTEEG